MIRPTEDLITDVRAQTGNEDYSALEGIPQTTMIQIVNDAKTMLQGVIMRGCPDTDLFDTNCVITTVSRQAGYGLPGTSTYTGTPTNAPVPWYSNSITLVEYSYTQRDDYYFVIEPINQRERSVIYIDPPKGYYVSGRSIYLSPPPATSNKWLKITYPRTLASLDIRRAKVSSATGTTLVLDSVFPIDSGVVDDSYYICLSDDTGVIQSNLLVSDYNSGTRTLTVDAVTDTSAAANTYVSIGKWSSCYHEFPFPCERYLVCYGKWRVFSQDSSSDADSTANELSNIEADILKNMLSVTKTAQHVPILDWSWLNA